MLKYSVCYVRCSKFISGLEPDPTLESTHQCVYLFHKSPLSNIMMITWNQPWKKYLHQINWQTLWIKTFLLERSIYLLCSGLSTLSTLIYLITTTTKSYTLKKKKETESQRDVSRLTKFVY